MCYMLIKPNLEAHVFQFWEKCWYYLLISSFLLLSPLLFWNSY